MSGELEARSLSMEFRHQLRLYDRQYNVLGTGIHGSESGTAIVSCRLVGGEQGFATCGLLDART